MIVPRTILLEEERIQVPVVNEVPAIRKRVRPAGEKVSRPLNLTNYREPE